MSPFFCVSGCSLTDDGDVAARMLTVDHNGMDRQEAARILGQYGHVARCVLICCLLLFSSMACIATATPSNLGAQLPTFPHTITVPGATYILHAEPAVMLLLHPPFSGTL